MNDITKDTIGFTQDQEENVQKLIKLFFKFHKTKWWHPDPSLGFKRSEMRLIFIVNDLEKHLSRKVSVSDISNFLRVTSPSVTHLLNSLEQKGIVVRTQDELDRRSVRVELTEEGQKIIAKNNERMDKSFYGLMEQLGPEKSEQFYELFSEVVRYFNQVNIYESFKKDEVY